MISGDFGYRDTIVFSVVGDTVNVAARLQEMSKEFDCEVVVSDEVLKTAGVPRDTLPARELTIRGRAEALIVRPVANATMLAGILEAVEATEFPPVKEEAALAQVHG